MSFLGQFIRCLLVYVLCLSGCAQLSVAAAAATATATTAAAGATQASGLPERWAPLADTVFRHLNQEQGLPNLGATALAQDASGFIWVGTQGGLARWDGYRFRNYLPDANDVHSLPDTYIYSLHLGSRGRLWVGTNEGGLARYDAQTDSFIRIPLNDKGVQKVAVLAMCDDGDDGLWIGTHTGLVHLTISSGKVRHIQSRENDPRSLPGAEVRSIKRDGKGRLWVATRNGLARQNGASAWLRFKLPHASTEPANIGTMALGSDGRLWVGTRNQGLFVLDLNTDAIAPVPLFGSSSSPLSHFMYEVKPGIMWVSSLGDGVLEVDMQTWRSRPIRHDPARRSSLADNSVLNMIRDRSGLIWLATPLGVDRFDPQQTALLNVFAGSSGISNNDVYSVSARPDGEIWLGLGKDGLNRIDATASRILPEPHGRVVGTGIVYGFSEQYRGKVYFVSNRGLFSMEVASQKIEAVQFAPMAASAEYETIYLDRTILWVGGADGLWRIDLKQTSPRAQRVESAPGLASSAISTFTLAADGWFWIGTQNQGMYRYHRDSHQLQHIVADRANPQALLPGKVGSVLIDSRGWLWVATQGGGISLAQQTQGAQPPQFTRIGKSQGLTNNLVNCLQEDAQGNIWLSTDDGLAVINPKTLQVRMLHTADGLGILGFWVHSGGESAHNELLFGGSGGMVVVRPAFLKEWTYQAPVVVTQLQIGGKLVPGSGQLSGQPDGKLRISPEANSLAVEFSALDYSAPERNQYAYWLEGYDAAWINTDASRRLASYTNLPPGEYTLHLRGSNRNGLLNDYPDNIRIEVLPFWWQTWWLRALLVLAGLGLMWGLIQVRTRYLRQRQLELEQQVQQRVGQLQEKQTELLAAYNDVQTANATLVQTQAQMLQQEKLASLGTLTAGIAHEINNPSNFAHIGAYNLNNDLTELHEFLWTLAGDDSQPEIMLALQHRFDKLTQSLGAIQEGTTRIRDLVRDLRTFSRLDEADWKAVAVGDNILATVHLVQTQYTNEVKIICDLAANPELSCWPAQLNQVFMNLIVNACQAIASRPPEVRASQPGRLEIRSRIDDNFLVLEFEDNGGGIPETNLDRVFDPFFTTKTVGDGMGMGLSIVHGIVQKHGGTIGVKSVLQVGTCFTLRLPLSVDRAP